MKSKCKLCSYIASRDRKTFVCDDCMSFSPILVKFHDLVEEKIKQIDNENSFIDAKQDDVFNFLSQISFIIYNHPSLSVFFRSASFLLNSAVQNNEFILESELSKQIRTVRSLIDVYKFLEFCGLITVTFDDDEKQRLIKLTPKLTSFASTYLLESISNQQQIKAAHILTGYIFLKICSLVALQKFDEIPYHINPKALWVTLMFIFKTVAEQIKEDNDRFYFLEKDFHSFLSKRGIQTSARTRILYGMKNLTGVVSQGLIEDIKEIIVDGDSAIKLEIADYVGRIYEILLERTVERDQEV